MIKHTLSVLAFMVITLAVQGGSHFWANKAHYDALTFTRDQPIMLMGIAAMIIQGIIMTTALHIWRGPDAQLGQGILIAVAFGLFLSSYISLAEPAKYAAPSILQWIRVEAVSTILQFGTFGILLGLIHRKFA